MAGKQGNSNAQVGVIYKITNPLGQIYIGQTKHFNNRMESYRKLDCKSQPLIYKSLKTYGFSHHTVSILCQCLAENLDKVEIELINTHRSCFRDNPEFGLNVLKESYAEYKKIKHKILSHKSKRVVRKIVQSDMWGQYIRTWDSAYAISKALGLNRRQILKTVRSKDKFLYGFKWQYEKVTRDS